MVSGAEDGGTIRLRVNDFGGEGVCGTPWR